MWLGVKGQSSSVIAGSLRNAFWCSVWCFPAGVELPDGGGPIVGTNASRTPNTVGLEPGSETAGDKLRGLKGNSPDRRLRALRAC